MLVERKSLVRSSVISPLYFNSLNGLVRLSLASTGLATLPENLLLGFPLLENLNLAGNNFEEVPQDLVHANFLRELNLGENPFKQLDDEDFKGLDKLKKLSICHMTR